MFNSQLLEEEIANSGYKIDFICSKLGISSQAFAKKRKGLIPFKLEEIKTMISLFRWDIVKVGRIFFDLKVKQ